MGRNDVRSPFTTSRDISLVIDPYDSGTIPDKCEVIAIILWLVLDVSASGIPSGKIPPTLRDTIDRGSVLRSRS